MNKIKVTLVRSNEIHDIFHVQGFGCYSGLDEYITRSRGLYSISDIATEFIK